MGAYGLAVAAAFAVALAVLVSVSSTPTAEAEVQTRSGTTFSALTGNASNGDTVYIQNGATEYVTFEITTVGKASASFAHSSATDEGQKITCDPGSAAGDCDADTTDAGVTVALKIDNDSGAGAIFVKQTQPGRPGEAATVDTITVEVAQVPTKISVKPAAKSINAGQGSQTATSTLVDLQLTDANGKGIAGETLTVVATRGVLVPASGEQLTWVIGGAGGDSLTLTADIGTLADDTRAQAGSVTTTADSDTAAGNTIDSAGYARVVLEGGGFPGIATITVTAGNITGTADVVLHGAPATIEATAEQSAIEAGGKTFIVVTAKDSSGNPVAAYNVDVKSGAKGVVGPSTAATKVEVDNDVNKDSDGDGTKDKGDIPACGTVAVVTSADQSGDPPTPALQFAANGTSDAGQCVIEVDGGSASGTADDAARGVHTITIQGPKADGSTDVSVEITVGGAPSTITHDAPERIDPSDEITVNLTVLDDEAHRVGRVTIEVLKTAGDGAIITEAADKTSDGRAEFTYLAPSTPGVVEFLARTKDANGKVTAKEPIIIQIAAEEPEEPVVPPEPDEPAMPEGEATLTFLSPSIASFSGGSVADLAAAAEAECPGGATFWVQADDGSWPAPYSTTATLAIANSPFEAEWAGGFGMTAVFFTECETDAMEDQS